MDGSCLFVIDTANHFGSVSDCAFSVESTLSKLSLGKTYVFTSHTLANDFSVLVDKHLRLGTLSVDSSISKREKICGCLGTHF